MGVERKKLTYQAPGLADAESLEEYMVTEGGRAVGKVVAVLENPAKKDERYVLVEFGSPPLASDRRAVPWRSVAGVHHGALTVALRWGAKDQAEEVELAGGEEKAVGPGEGEAVLERVEEVPREVRVPSVPAAAAGPEDSATIIAAFSTAGVGFLALLGGIALLGEAVVWGWLFIGLAVFLLAAAGVLAYQAWLRPYVVEPELSGWQRVSR